LGGPATAASGRSKTRARAAASRRRLGSIAAAGGLLLAIVFATVLWRGREQRPPEGSRLPAPPAEKRIVVLPFENLGAAEDAYFADGLADEIRSKLTGLPGLAVIARASANHYRETTKTPTEIAQELGVRYLLAGTVRWQGSGAAARIRVTPELVAITGGGAPTTGWQDTFEADLRDVFEVQGDIAKRVTQALELQLNDKERERLAERPTAKVEAYEAYLRGRQIERGGAGAITQRRAGAQYEQAVALDPRFAAAWAALSMARTHEHINGLPSPELAAAARVAAEKARELDRELPEAELALGDYYRMVEFDAQRALDVYTRGLRKAPDHPDLLARSAAAEQYLGRWEEAIAPLQRARSLDPHSWRIALYLGDSLAFLGRPEQAREAYDKGLDAAPANSSLVFRKAVTYLIAGDLAGARGVIAALPKEVERTALVATFGRGELQWSLEARDQELLLRLTPAAFGDDRTAWVSARLGVYALRGDREKVREHAEIARREIEKQLAVTPDFPGLHADHGMALAYLGRSEEAVRAAERAVALLPVERNAFRGPEMLDSLARIHVLAGNHDAAIDLLERLVALPFRLSPAWLRIDPRYDPLRGNPRFERLVARR
jgi:TolB-like protein/tetratricopeptide (TPR) repeat protein